MGHAEFRNDST